MKIEIKFINQASQQIEEIKKKTSTIKPDKDIVKYFTQNRDWSRNLSYFYGAFLVVLIGLTIYWICQKEWVAAAYNFALIGLCVSLLSSHSNTKEICDTALTAYDSEQARADIAAITAKPNQFEKYAVYADGRMIVNTSDFEKCRAAFEALCQTSDADLTMYEYGKVIGSRAVRTKKNPN